MSRIADRFGRAAATYDAVTPVQQEVADRLAERILASTSKGARVAEFGCGTGRLARALDGRLAPSLWIATDLAPAMAAAARAATPLVAVMDAAQPALAPGFDLVCSSLTLQWLDDPAAALAAWRALVAPGGRLAVATLIDGSFAEWRQALAGAGAEAPSPRFPSLSEARAWFSPGAVFETLSLTERHPDALAFLRALRLSGADAADSPALPAGTMRRAMRAFEASGGSTTYEVLIGLEKA
jgi:malonyl-CoA O-methyltransferase